MSEHVPKWLTDELSQVEEWPIPELGEAGKDIEAGAICVAQGPNHRQSVLVANAEDEQYARVYLLSHEVEIATDADLRLEPEETGLGYKVLLQGDISSTVRKEDLQRIGRVGGKVGVDTETLDLASKLYADREISFAAAKRGLPLRAPDDDRWAWKSEQIRIMQDIATPAINQLLD